MNTNETPMPSSDTKKVFPLKFPVMYQNTRYTTLSFRRPKVKDTRFLQEENSDPIGAQNNFFASLANVPPGVFDELDLIDMRAINAWFQSFTGDIETKS
jgi:hypothetical protein